MMDKNPVLESTRFVVENSTQVRMHPKKIDEFCTNYDEHQARHWLKESPFDLEQFDDKQKLNFLMLFNSISFSYWGEPKWTVEYEKQKYDGSWAMILSLGNAIFSDENPFEMSELSNLTIEKLGEALKGNIEIPMLEERWKILLEAGVVMENYDYNFENVITAAKGDALHLLEILTKEFPFFDDTAMYNGQKVYFYKRAQLLISDIYLLFRGGGLGAFKNMDKITACADYKLPQVLRKLGIISYSKELEEKIDSMTEIAPGSEEEVEIRAATVWAVELIKEKLKQRVPDVNSIDINDHIWLAGQTKSPDDKPYHRTRTTAY